MTQLRLMTLAVRLACARIGMEWDMEHRRSVVTKTSATGRSM